MDSFRAGTNGSGGRVRSSVSLQAFQSDQIIIRSDYKHDKKKNSTSGNYVVRSRECVGGFPDWAVGRSLEGAIFNLLVFRLFLPHCY